jgi:hypothetical protein
VSALTEDRLQLRPVDRGWVLPTDPAKFLALLARTPSLGNNPRERVATFMQLPAAEQMPLPLRRALQKRGLA